MSEFVAGFYSKSTRVELVDTNTGELLGSSGLPVLVPDEWGTVYGKGWEALLSLEGPVARTMIAILRLHPATTSREPVPFGAIGDLVGMLKRDRSVVSRHLKVLVDKSYLVRVRHGHYLANPYWFWKGPVDMRRFAAAYFNLIKARDQKTVAL